MVAKTPRTRKPAPPVTVRPVDVFSGLYSTLSSDGHTWYTTDVKTVTCSCKAGQDGFARCRQMPYCKHMFASKLIARALAGMTREARAYALQVAGPTHVRVDVVLARMAAYEQAVQAAA